MNTIDDYKDRFDSPIGITNVRGPHVIDRVTLEYVTGNKDMCFTFIMSPRFKERLTITESKISYKHKDFENDGAETTWSYSSSSEWFQSQFEMISKIGMEIESVYKPEDIVFDVVPIVISLHFRSGETKKYNCYFFDTLLANFTEEVAKLIPSQEGTPKFMTEECDFEMGLPGDTLTEI